MFAKIVEHGCLTLLDSSRNRRKLGRNSAKKACLSHIQHSLLNGLRILDTALLPQQLYDEDEVRKVTAQDYRGHQELSNYSDGGGG